MFVPASVDPATHYYQEVPPLDRTVRRLILTTVPALSARKQNFPGDRRATDDEFVEDF